MSVGCRWRRSILVPALLALVSLGCGMQRVNFNGQAMAPTFNDGESAIAIREVGILERGQIVAFRSPRDESRSFVSRIVGLPGDEISSDAGFVSINGERLDEPYVIDDNRSIDSWGPRRVPDGEYFVMGDNRRNSSDSRSWGTVTLDAIWARVPER